MDEATREKILDERIQARLARDLAYRNASSAELQDAREKTIEDEEIARLDREQAARS